MGHTGLFFFIFIFSTQLTVIQCLIKVCRCQDSNRGSLVLEDTALPTEPHHCPITCTSYCSIKWHFATSEHKGVMINGTKLKPRENLKRKYFDFWFFATCDNFLFYFILLPHLETESHLSPIDFVTEKSWQPSFDQNSFFQFLNSFQFYNLPEQLLCRRWSHK